MALPLPAVQLVLQLCIDRRLVFSTSAISIVGTVIELLLSHVPCIFFTQLSRTSLLLILVFWLRF